MILLFCAVVIFSAGIYAFMHQPAFGKMPSGKRLEQIKKSPHYQNGAFQNLIPTPIIVEGVNPLKIMRERFKTKGKRLKPLSVIPSKKTDLLNLNRSEEILVWFGHSSCFIQMQGKTFLIDPVFSGHASMMPAAIKAFKGTDIYTDEDMPEIDYLLITHDHWDHLDYKTIKQLRPKVKQVICGLGAGEHLEYWGYAPEMIIEKDWYDTVVLDKDMLLHTFPSRHFSGRNFKRNKSLWTTFILESPNKKIFIGCDGGYGNHFAEAAAKFGGFDLALLENGQFNQNWRYIHSMPEEFIQAAKDLNAKRVIPIHSCKFALALHDWDYPLKKICELNSGPSFQLLTPMIGETVYLNDTTQQFSKWWEGIN